MAYVFVMFPDNRIREFRKKAGLSQSELGARVGMHQTMVGNIENGQRSLTLEWARRFAKELGVSVADLLSDADNPMRLTPEEARLLEAYRSAPDAQKPNIEMVATTLASGTKRASKAA